MHAAQVATSESVPADPGPSLFERMGGREGVAALVTAFVKRLRGDEELAPRFAPIDDPTLEAEFAAFVTHALRGDAKDRRAADGASPALWLEAEAFGRVVVHLWSTLLGLDAPDDLKILVSVAVVQRALGYDDV
jgi:truncated hemoglobin YjbI